MSTGLDIRTSDNIPAMANFVRVLDDTKSQLNVSTTTQSLLTTQSRKYARFKPKQSRAHKLDLSIKVLDSQPSSSQASDANSNLAHVPEQPDIDWTNIEVMIFNNWIPEHDMTGKLRLGHNLRPLNKICIQDTGLPP